MTLTPELVMILDYNIEFFISRTVYSITISIMNCMNTSNIRDSEPLIIYHY